MNSLFKHIQKKAAKNLKKSFYRNKMRSFKTIILFMTAGGVVCAAFNGIKYIYQEYAVSTAYVSLTYPQITSSQYPDSSRFTYYDFISLDRINEAIEMMKKNGKYENYTAEELEDSFYLYAYLTGDVSSTVSEMRSMGNDFSYIANEYKITYTQPHDYKNSNIFKRIFTPDYSNEFLQALMTVNNNRIKQLYGGMGGFENLISSADMSDYDYSEKIGVYKNKIEAIVNYLNEMGNTSVGFVSEEHNKTLQDIISEYKMLSSNKLDGISSFIDASGLTKDKEVAINKLNINLENNNLKLKMYDDECKINEYAQSSYDHTFTENLIVVTNDEEKGLYQARPKTAFDTIVEQKHTAQENYVDKKQKVTELTDEITVFGKLNQDQTEYARLCSKCDELIKEFEEAFASLNTEASSVVSSYYNETNKDFLTSRVERKSVFTTGFMVQLGLDFCLGAVIMFIVYALLEITRNIKTQNNTRIKIKRFKEQSN